MDLRHCRACRRLIPIEFFYSQSKGLCSERCSQAVKLLAERLESHKKAYQSKTIMELRREIARLELQLQFFESMRKRG